MLPGSGQAQMTTYLEVTVVGTYTAPANKAVYSLAHDDTNLYVGLATDDGSNMRVERVNTATMTMDMSFNAIGHESVNWASIYTTGNFIYAGAFHAPAQIWEWNKTTGVNTRVWYGVVSTGQDNITSITGQGRYLYVTFDVSTGPVGGRIDKIDTLSIFPNMAVTATWHGTATQNWIYTSYFNEADGFLYAGVHNPDGFPGIGPSLFTPTIVKIDPNPVGTTTMTHSAEWNGDPNQKYVEGKILKNTSTGNLYFNFNGWLSQSKPNGILELNPTTMASAAYWGGSLDTTAVLATEIDPTNTFIYLVTDQTPFKVIRLALPLSASSNDYTWTAPAGVGMNGATELMYWDGFYYIATGTPTGGQVFKVTIDLVTSWIPTDAETSSRSFSYIILTIGLLAIGIAIIYKVRENLSRDTIIELVIGLIVLSILFPVAATLMLR